MVKESPRLVTLARGSFVSQITGVSPSQSSAVSFRFAAVAAASFITKEVIMFGCMLEFRGLWDLEMVIHYGLMNEVVEIIKSRNNYGWTAIVTVEVQGSFDLEHTGSVYIQFFKGNEYIETKEIEFDV